MKHCYLKCFLLILSLLATGNLQAGVIVTAATGGNCLPIAPGAYTTLGNIEILETFTNDMPVQSATTIILSAPAGFEFQAATGAVSYQAGRNITSASIAVTTTTITVTITVTATNRIDRITISGIAAISLAAGNSGNILRTGGTATVTGNNAGGGISHGYLTSNGTGILVTSVANGNWYSGATWSTGVVPACGEDIQINHTVTADAAVSTGNLSIGTGGNLISTNPVTVTSTFTISGAGTYTHNNASDATTTIFAGTESFAATSNLVINQWYSLAAPLANPITGDFGNITFNVAGTWQQNGKFSPSRIQGNIIISNGTVVMDNGTGLTTSLALQDVTITGSGNLTVHSGSNRNLNLTTNNFYDYGTGASLTSISSGCAGIISWTVTGDIILNDNFSFIDNAGVSTASLIASGDLDITGGDINFINATNAAFTYNVTGNTTISGAPTRVTFVNSGSSALQVTTGGLIVTGGLVNEIMSGSFTGTNLIDISNNLEVTGATSSLIIVNNTSYTFALNLTVGNDILVTNADLYFANSGGGLNITCDRHMILAGTTSLIEGQVRVSSPASCDLTVSGTFTLGSGATFYLSHGQGNISLTVGELFAISNGYFFGIYHTVGPAAPLATFSFQDFEFNGGSASMFDVKTSANTLVTINCSNNFTVNWLANTDWVELVSYDGNNDASLNLTVGGDFTVTGNFASAYLLSSQAGGVETVNISGSLSVSGGTVMFVCDNTSTSGVDAHNIVTNISGDINISGGTTYLSTRDGLATVNVTGDVNISAGILNLKWLSGVAELNITGDYNQTGGAFNFHAHTTSIIDTLKVNVYGAFIQTGGILNFDNSTGSTKAEHKLFIKGTSCTLDGTAVWTHANNLTNNPIFGQVFFESGTTTTYNRNSSTHEIQHVKQTVMTGTTVGASASPNGFRMTSNVSSNATIHTGLNVYGILDMGSGVISSRAQANYYSRMVMQNGGRLRLSHTGGFYSGTATASTLNGMISGLNRANFYLFPSSIVEYYGTATMIVTGITNGIANSANHKYGILEINHTGTPGASWVYPETDEEVYVRTELRLTDGEFNLDIDHATAGGGRTINVENGGTITRSTGFIRSETEDGSGDLRWYISTNGSYTIPFGYDETQYIPFTYQQTAGNTGALLMATYRSIPDNTPYPPTVTHVDDVFGNDNSAFTIDRFWKIEVTGTATTSMTYTFTASEGTGIISPRAQRWEPVSRGWFPPTGGQSNPTGTTTLATTISSFNSWWTLSALSSPLPVELISFEIAKTGDDVKASWSTASELNNDYFTLERSNTGQLFESVGVIDGSGTTSTLSNYLFTDIHPFTGINYYRLKQTDLDGRFTYSEVRTILMKNPSYIQLYPNPVINSMPVTITIPAEGESTLKIVDQAGRIVLTEHFNADGATNYQFYAPSMQGTYQVFIETIAGTAVQKLVVGK